MLRNFARCVITGVLVACSSSETQSTDMLVVGNYEIVGLRTLPNGLGDNRLFSLHISEVAASTVTFQITQGDVAHTLPAPGTATHAGDGYTAQWNGNATYNYSITFRAGSCEGSDINGGGTVTAWVTCSIRLVQ